jgi:hypothetical protein
MVLTGLEIFRGDAVEVAKRPVAPCSYEACGIVRYDTTPPKIRPAMMSGVPQWCAACISVHHQAIRRAPSNQVKNTSHHRDDPLNFIKRSAADPCMLDTIKQAEGSSPLFI